MASCRCCCAALVAVVALLVGHSLYIWPDVSVRHISAGETSPDLLSGCPQRAVAFRPEELQERGVSVFPNFFSGAEVEELLNLYRSKENTAAHSLGKQGGIKNIESDELLPWHSRVWDLVMQVQNATDIRPGNDVMFPGECSAHGVSLSGQFFHTNNIDPTTSASLGWHQDAELGIMWPRAYDVLSVYVFLEKSHPGEGGLSIIPFDLLQKRSPELHDYVKGTASRNFIKFPQKKNRTIVIGILQDELIEYNQALEEVECVPELRPGDALIFRGDVIHGTQACKTPGAFRTSMALRLLPIVDMSPLQLISGKLRKAEYMNYATLMCSQHLTCSLMAYHPWMIPYRAFMTMRLFPAMLKLNLWYKRLLGFVRTQNYRILLGGLSGDGS